MARYATKTEVTVERSRAEIEETLRRYGASEFHSGWRADAAMIAFRLNSLFIRFVLPIPDKGEKRFTHAFDRRSKVERRRTELAAEREWDQEVRARWRGLLLNIKGKLEATELGITTVEEEFLAHIVIGGGAATLGEWILNGGRLQALIDAKTTPQLGFKPAVASDEVIDAEIEQKSN